jgi:hypothetical protein
MTKTPELSNLMGAYLHQDWRHEYGSWQAAVDDFSHEDTEWVAAAVDQLDALLRDSHEDALRDQMATLGNYYDPARIEGDYRTWLTAVRDRLTESLTGRRPTSADGT